jgi:hypothetical protein
MGLLSDRVCELTAYAGTTSQTEMMVASGPGMAAEVALLR